MSLRYLFLALFICSQFVLMAGDRQAPSARPLQTSQLEFVPNRGQFRNAPGSTDTMLYVAHDRGTSCFLSRNAIHYVQSVTEPPLKSAPLPPQSVAKLGEGSLPNFDEISTRQHRIDVAFVGANPHPRISEHDSTDGTLNYYLDGVRVEGVRAVRRLVYHDLYPHVDLVLYADSKGLKYDFVVHPGGDPNDIVMRYGGAKSLSLMKDGRCRAKTSLGTIDELRPYTYQQRLDVPSPTKVSSSFVRKGTDVSFRVGRYDKTRELVIDPSVEWATYYGGNGNDWGSCIQTDADGNIVMASSTSSTTQIATTGAHDVTMEGTGDAYIVKFNSNGVRQWGTYFGSTGGEGAAGIAIGADGTIFVGGTTNSDNLATVGAHKEVKDGLRDAFVASFTEDGQLRWSTYFGGDLLENVGFSGLTQAVTLTSNGNVAVGGNTNSTQGIATANAHSGVYSPGGDGFLAVFDPDGVLQWATYVGGENSENVYAVAGNHANGQILVVGETWSATDIATVGAHDEVLSGDRDAFIMSFNNDGVLQWGTYCGGDGEELFFGVGCSDNGAICVTGQSSSATDIATVGAFRTTLIGLWDIFAMSFTADGAQIWGTYYGEVGFNEYGNSASFRGENAYITGITSTTVNIATADGVQTTLSGTSDVFIVKFNNTGQRIWGSYYGGTGLELGSCIRAGQHHSVYLSGLTQSTNGISTPGSHQPTRHTGNDAYLVKICDLPKPVLTASPNDSICAGEVVEFSVVSESPVIRWFNGSTQLTALNDATTYTTPITLSPGVHSIWVEVGSDGCTMRSDTIMLQVHVLPVVVAMNDTAVCMDATLRLDATATTGTAPYAYKWSPAGPLDNPNVQRPLATLRTPTTFLCTVTDAHGCTGTEAVFVDIRPEPSIAMADSLSVCPGDGVTLGDTSAVLPRYTYLWSPADGLSSIDSARPLASPTTPTLYHVVVTDTFGCTTQDSVFVDIRLKPLPNITPSGRVVLCGTDSVTLKADAGYITYLWNTGSTSSSIVVDRAGNYAVTVTGTDGCEGTSDTVRVVVSPMPEPVITGPDAVCLNANNVYDVPGAATDTYVWTLVNGGTILSTTPPGSATVLWTSAGTWTLGVEVTNTDGCSASASIDVVVADSLQPQITPAGPITLCKDASIVLRASKGFVSYAWSTGATSDSIIVTTSGEYFVTVLGQGGCDGVSNHVIVTVLPNPPPSPNVVASDTVICEGDSATLTLSPGAFTSYRWNTGATSDGIVVRTPGKYFASVINSQGCSGMSDTIEIRVAALPDTTISTSGPTTFCKGNSVTLTAPAGPWSYEWTTSETTQSIVAATSGSYAVRIISIEGCTSISYVTVVVHERPDAVISGPDAVCFSTSASYTIATTPTTPASVVWSLAPAALGTIINGQGTTTIEVQWGTTSGTATLTAIVTSAEGCSDTATLDVVIDAALRPTITPSGPTTFCDGDSVVLRVANGFASYQWSDASGTIAGATSRALTVRISGIYACTVTNTSGCTGVSNTMAVVVHPLPPRPIITNAGIVLSSTPALSYQWSVNGSPILGATSQTHAPTSAGSYTVTITDANGCSATSDPYSYAVFPTATIAVGFVPRVDPNRTIEIPIDLRNSADLDASGATSYRGTLRYNGTMILPTGSRGGSVTLPDQAVAGGSDRLVVFEGQRGNITAGTLQWLQFVTLLGNDTCTPLVLSDVMFTDAAVDISLEHGAFCESGICITDGEVRLINTDTRLALMAVHPNPARDIVEIAYELKESGRTQLMLMNVLGRSVRTIVDEELRHGRHQTSLDVNDLSPGWYQMILITPTEVRNQLIMIGGR